MSSPPPTVWLVGAGPGDPELLTRKAHRVLTQATLVLVDDLVSPGVLALLPDSCRVIRVGKRGGKPSTEQAFIQKLMVQAAWAGEQVVRLKGGDPFLFGRGAEEWLHLHHHGIAVEVVNGLSAGQALTGELQLSLTHRDHAHGVIWITGHGQAHTRAINWAQVGQTAVDAKLTLVIYMGMMQGAHIAQDLSQTMPSSTPVLFVEWVSHPQQRHVLTDLCHWESTVKAHQLASPCMIVVGHVVSGWAALQQAGETTNALMRKFSASD